MAIYLGRWGWRLGLAGVLLWGEANFLGSPTLAQITPDATLGAESSVVKPNVNVRGISAERIEGGAVRGANLFHSFQEFNVGDGQRVYFANPAGIENILSRVTGNNLSNILGTLGVDGGANLFLLNPNGIIFGPNAKLDIAGSFVASTANSVVFDNGFEFNAKNPATPPLLTVNIPLGLQYGTNQPRTTITNTGNLAVGQNLTLDAGNLDLQGQLQAGNNLTLQAQDTVKIRDSITNPFVAAAGGQLLIQGNQLVDIFALNHPNSGLYSGGDMVLQSANAVGGDAHYWSGGNFRVEQLDGSLGNLESPHDPIFEVAGDFSLANYLGPGSLQILAGGSVTIPGIVTISSGGAFNDSSVTLSNGTLLTISGTTRPTVDIRAGTTTFFGTPTAGTPTSANITIGNIDVPSPNGLVLLTNQYQPNLTLPSGNIKLGIVNARSDSGNGGSVFIDSRNGVTIGPGFISTRSSVGNSGDIAIVARDAVYLGGNGAYISSSGVGARSRNAGNITITAGSLFIDGGSFIEANTSGIGNAGNININVRDTTSLINSAISSSVESGAVGKGGTIAIQAGTLLLDGATNGLFAATGIGASGQAGNITVSADTVRIINGAAIDASTANSSKGGSIALNVNNLLVTGGGQILATSEAAGNAGEISIAATDTVNVSNGFVSTGSIAAGDGGNLSLRARQFNIDNGGQVVTSSSGTGKAGNLAIAATDSVNVSNQAFIITSSTGTGDSGNLAINARQLNVNTAGQVSTGSSGAGKAGDLAIAATDSVNVNSQGIVATSSTGASNSGNLAISTRQLNISDPGSLVNTMSLGSGNAGNLAIAATDSVTVSNEGLLTTGTNPGSAGNGGTLSINTRQVDVKDGGKIDTASTGTGNSGNLAIAASDSMNVVNRGVVTTSSDQGAGVAGRLNIETGRLSIRDNSLVVSSTIGAGDAGDVTVRAADSIEVVNSSKLSADTLGRGNGGNLNIQTNKLTIQDSEVSTGTLRGSSGKGGTLRVNVNDAVEISGVGGLVTATLGQGKGGDIQLSANSLSLTNGGSITSLSDGQDKAGNITVNLTGNLRSSGGNISASSLSAGGGNIDITADDIRLRDSSLISTSVFDSTGGGGNITINSTVFLAIEDSDILANAQAGPGGDITINSSGFIADLFSSGAAVAVGRNPGDFTQFRGNGRNDISVSLAASSRSNGRVDISTASATGSNGISNYSYRDPTQGAATLPSDLVDPEGLIDRRCAPNNSAKKSSFTITGRGGLPPNPTDPLTNDDVWVDWITLQDRQANVNGAATDANPTHSQPTQLVEAQSWVVGSEGQVILTAAAPTVTPASSGLVVPSCEDNQAATP